MRVHAGSCPRHASGPGSWASPPDTGSRTNWSIVFVGAVVVRYSERPSGAIAMPNANLVFTAGWHPVSTDDTQPKGLSMPPGRRANAAIASEEFDGV